MAQQPRKEPRLSGSGKGDDAIPFDRDDAPVKGKGKKKGRRWLWILLTLFIVTGGAAVAGWVAISMLTNKGGAGGMGHVRAPEGPVKIRPEQPGGMAVPDRNRTVYDRIDGTPPPPVERLLPPPEKPVPMPRTQPGATEQAMPAAPSAPPAAPSGTTQPMPPAQSVQRPVLRDAPAASVATPPPPPAPAQAAPSPSAPAAKPQPVPSAPMTSTASPAVAAPGGRYMVQLAAVRDEHALDAELQRLRKVHGDLLGNLTHTVVRADLGDKGIYYRLRMGPLANEAAAKALCAELEKRNAACLVVRP